MPQTFFSLVLLQWLLIVGVVAVFFHLIHKWMNRHYDVREEQNALLKEALDLLKQKFPDR
ncbi:hypothetical protein V9K67_17765 [Paraflavisolibacter sp. H34]|uniref:hypothetical protein n=1 Tax=Huijunlia imazamoxiresistens TaxID=3127457 RepID=UPI00301A1039